jgi:hypothetical protein
MLPLESTKLFIEANKNNLFQYDKLPPGTIQDQAKFIWNGNLAGWLELDISAPYVEMLTEARAVKHLFVKHRDFESEGWRSLCLHGISSEKTNSATAYGLDQNDDSLYHWTEIANLCPVTAKYFQEQFPYAKYHRIRFMLVEPGGYIQPHSDLTQPNLNAAVNISLNNPNKCRLTSELGTVPFRDSGSVFLFNNYYRHAVYNNSDVDRFHIIVHGLWRNPEYLNLLVNSYQRALDGQNN